MCPPLIKPVHSTASDPSCLNSQKMYGDVCSFKCDNGYGIPSNNGTCGSNTIVLAKNIGGNEFCERIDEFGSYCLFLFIQIILARCINENYIIFLLQ